MKTNEILELADHVEIHFGDYKILNAVNGNWLVMDKRTEEYVEINTGSEGWKRLSVASIDEAYQHIQEMNYGLEENLSKV